MYILTSRDGLKSINNTTALNVLLLFPALLVIIKAFN